MKSKRWTRRLGLTLVELLVSISIIVMLVGISAATYLHAYSYASKKIHAIVGR